MRNGLPRYAEWNYGPQRWQMHNLAVQHEANNAAMDAWTLRLAAQRFEESRIARDLNSTNRST